MKTESCISTSVPPEIIVPFLFPFPHKKFHFHFRFANFHFRFHISSLFPFFLRKNGKFPLHFHPYTWHRRDAYIHDHCLRYRHNFALFYQLIDSNLFTTVLFSILRESSSETYGPRVYFPSYKFRSTILVSNLLFLQSFTFRSINQKYQKYSHYRLSICIRSHLCK